jgi:hypothetical protein
MANRNDGEQLEQFARNSLQEGGNFIMEKSPTICQDR